MSIFLFIIAILTPLTSSGISIFRHPSSSFSSGEISLENLNEGFQKTITKTQYLISTSNIQNTNQLKALPKKIDPSEQTSDHWIPAQQVYTAIDLCFKANVNKTTPLRKNPFPNEEPFHSLNSQKEVQVMFTENNWAYIYFFLNSNPQFAWVQTEHLTPPPSFNSGLVLHKTNLHFSVQPEVTSSHVLNPGDKITILELRNNWAKIKFKNSIGYLPIKDILTPLHFAHSIVVKGKSVRIDLNKILSFFSNKRIRFDQIDSIQLNPKQIFVKNLSLISNYNPIENKLNSHHLFQFKDVNTKTWAQSHIRRHGNIWWVMPNEITQIKSKTFSTQEVFRLPVYSYAVCPKHKNIMFASSNGIYQTWDGVKWKKLDLFEDKNYPIAISQNGIVFIGPYVSHDNGKSFQQFIRWDKIINQINVSGPNIITNLHINKISLRDPTGNHIMVSLDSNGKKYTLLTTDAGLSWIAL